MTMRVSTLRRDPISFNTGCDLGRNPFLDGRMFAFTVRFITSNAGNLLASVLVSLAKVTLGDWDLAMRAVAKLDSSIAASKVGTNQLLAVFNILRNDKVGSLVVYIGSEDAIQTEHSNSASNRNSTYLEIMIHGHSASATRYNH
jgi:hypothetical protein